GLLRVEGAREFVEQETQGLGEALIDLHGGSDAGEKVVLGGVTTEPVTEKGKPSPGREDSAAENCPGEKADPVDFVLNCCEGHNGNGEQDVQGQRSPQTVAQPDSPADEQKQKPRGHRKWRDVEKDAEGQQVAQQRKTPIAITQKVF